MFNSPIEEIKSRLDIADVVGQYVKLQKAGANFRAPCPFHSEKKPSFFVSPARQIWHCFGCGVGGGIFDFVMKIEGIEFREALHQLAQRAGVELKPQDPKEQTERQRLYEICELAAKFFEKQLYDSKVGQEARGYLLSRKVTQESVKKWRIGYAPDNWTALSDFLAGRGYAREEVERAGLAIKKDGVISHKSSVNSYFDRFRGRIMFPVCDIQGRVVGFGGRIFQKDDPAKYVNTPSTPLYDKSGVLYGLDKSKVEIRRRDACVLVEGYMDAIMLAQTGYENVVAASGTALTPLQLRILKRYSENISTAFDMDSAGDMATKRSCDLAQEFGFNVRVVMMPQGKDPADVAAENPSAFAKLLSESRSIMDFYFESALLKFDAADPGGKKNIAKAILPAIKRIPNSIEKAHWRQRLADVLHVSEEDVEKELRKVVVGRESFIPRGERTAAASDAAAENVRQPKSRRELLEEYIVALLLRWRQKAELVEDRFVPLFSLPLRSILTSLKSHGAGPSDAVGSPAVTFATASSELSSDSKEWEQRLGYLMLRAESEEDVREEDAEAELRWALAELHSLEQRRHLEEVARELREAERARDAEKAQALFREFHKLSRRK